MLIIFNKLNKPNPNKPGLNIEDLWYRFALSFYKMDRIHSFDIRYSLFDIRYSLFYKLRKTGSLFRLDWPLFRPAAALKPEH